ncbi:hypothetical protein [Chryseobacterium sp. CT-SW4]|uniref:hypothetical protein n=1 Tax=Chryseobacterium sp. SW-1 TaxID=3157343 RepID=UPI003B01230A
MKLLISIFIIFTMAVRPVLPLVNYAVNYDYIVKNLCVNKDKPLSTCKGKCYVEKELVKTEKQSGTSTVKIPVMEAFLSCKILVCPGRIIVDRTQKAEYNGDSNFSTSEYFTKIFRPPLA